MTTLDVVPKKKPEPSAEETAAKELVRLAREQGLSLTGLGPLTVFSGIRDILQPDIRLLIDKARTAGIDVDYHEQPGLVHVYPLTPTPEGRDALAILIERLRTTQPAA